MIPLRLKIKGLYSYQSEQEIDFEQLTSSSLFGIFGPVGSGKSTILEAITFALYGDTERLNSRQNRNYNMMNLRSNELFIDFVCRAGKDDQKYRFTVKGKRNSKRFEDVGTLERKAYQWFDELNDWSPISIDNPAQYIIGLDYNNFKRTIIIPQGNFQEFIELGGTDKSEMMQRIFGLDKFDLGAKVTLLVNKNKEKLAEIEGQLSNLGDATNDLLEQKKHELKLLQTDLNELQTALVAWIEKEKNIESLRKLFDDFEKVNQQVGTLKNQEVLFQEKEKQLERYEKCLLHFKSLIDLKTSKLTENKNDKQALKAKIEEADTLTKVIKEQKDELEKVRPFYEKREEFKEKATDFGHVVAIARLAQNQISEKERIENGNKIIEQKKQEIEQLKQQKQTTETQLVNFRKESELLLAEWEKENVQLKVQQALQQHADTLQPNEPCPLCGSLHHPDKVKSDIDFAALIAGIEQKKTERKNTEQQLEKQLKTTEKTIETASDAVIKFEKGISEIVAKLSGIESSISTHTEHLRHLQWNSFSEMPVEEIEAQKIKADENYSKIITKYEKHDTTIRKNEPLVSNLLGQIEELKKRIASQEESISENQKSIELALQHYDFGSEEEVISILKQTRDVAAERKQITDFVTVLSATKTKADDLKTQTQGKTYDAEEHTSLKTEIENKTLMMNELQKKSGGLEKEIERIEKEIGTKVTLQKEKDTLAIRADNLTTLASLFKSKGFVNFISSVYLKNLCLAANERFHRMTSQQLHLEINDSNDFEVRDLLNGGRTRLLKTLSGGQKFQAALSLALALADNIHHRHQSKHNFFFLDEGFGSLDKQALQVVFETLHSLRKENRIVGIISHVDELQQEIPTYLKIENTEEGSQIRLGYQ